METLTDGESIDPTDRKRPMAGVTGVFGFGSDIFFHFLFFFCFWLSETPISCFGSNWGALRGDWLAEWKSEYSTTHLVGQPNLG